MYNLFKIKCSTLTFNHIKYKQAEPAISEKTNNCHYCKVKKYDNEMYSLISIHNNLIIEFQNYSIKKLSKKIL